MQARLNIYAETEVIEISDNTELYDLLKPDNYKFRPERMLIFHINAYDWNCPQHITPRYTSKEMEPMLEEQNEYIRSLEEQLQRLKSELLTREISA